MRLHCEIHEDGSFSIRNGEKRLIENCFPGIDDAPVRPLKTQVSPDGSAVKWITRDGEIELTASWNDPDDLQLSCRLTGYDRPIEVIWLMYRAQAFGVRGCYQAARGMGNDTGYLSGKQIDEKGKVVSYGLGSLQYEGKKENLTFFADRCDHYETVCVTDSGGLLQALGPAWKSGEIKGKKTGRSLISIGFKVEKTLCGKNVEFPKIIFRAASGMEDGLEYAADRIGKNMGARLTMPPAYHWCSWYYCYQNYDIVQLKEYLEGFGKMVPAVPLHYFQLDVGYCPSIGDWLTPNERFPNGLEEAFRMIREAGYLPGIWVGAFMVGNRSRLYQEHPDWILYDLEDRPVRAWITDNEPKPWGYQDEEYYVLDSSHPDAMAYMKNVFETLYKWGARMFKTDFMLWGLQDSARVKRHTPGKTGVEYFREFLDMVRNAIGEESYWLGCIAPFLPFVGYADGMRIGGDVGSSWDGEFGPQNMIRCLVGNNYTNHHYYQTDPDAVMMRNYQIRLDQREIESLALLAAVSGGCIYTSDALHKIAKERTDLFRFIEPDRRRKPSLPFLEEERREIVMVHKNAAKGLVFLFNPSNEIVKERYGLKELGFSGTEKVVDFNEEKEVPSMNGTFWTDIEPHGYRLFIVSSDDKITIDKKSLWKNLD